MKRTVPHKSYSEPTRQEIQSCFSEIGFNKSYSHDLVRDIANVISHVEAYEDIESSLLNVESQISTANKSQEEIKEEIGYHTNIQTFLKSLDYTALKGNTPIQKASTIIAALSNQEGGEPSEGDGDIIPIFQDSSKEDIKKNTEKMQEDIEAFLEANKSLAKYLINPDEVSEQAALANLTNSQKDLISKLAVLGSRGKIKSKKTSAIQTIEQMSEYSQVACLANMTALALPTFNYKFASKQLIVKSPKQSSKQMVVLLIDNSGSMAQGDQKLAWVKALMIDRLEGVSKGQSELFICWFENDVDNDNIIHISTKQNAIDFLKKNFIGNFNGGSTNIQKAVTSICEGIKTNRLGTHSLKGENPQIVVINDGQDDVDSNFKPEVTTHGFILGRDNNGMKSMISNCRGHYERFL